MGEDLCPNGAYTKELTMDLVGIPCTYACSSLHIWLSKSQLVWTMKSILINNICSPCYFYLKPSKLFCRVAAKKQIFQYFLGLLPASQQ